MGEDATPPARRKRTKSEDPDTVPRKIPVLGDTALRFEPPPADTPDDDTPKAPPRPRTPAAITPFAPVTPAIPPRRPTPEPDPEPPARKATKKSAPAPVEAEVTAPKKAAPAKKAPAKKATAKKAAPLPVKQATPAKKAPAEKAPAEKAPAEKAPAEKPPAEKAPVKRATKATTATKATKATPATKAMTATPPEPAKKTAAKKAAVTKATPPAALKEPPPPLIVEPAPTASVGEQSHESPGIVPAYLPETLALAAVEHLGAGARRRIAWYRLTYPDANGDALSRAITHEFVRRARRQGFAAGLVGPTGLVVEAAGVAWLQARLVLHLAAAHGHDPEDRRRAAELLVLQRVHGTVETAEAALRAAERRDPGRATAPLARMVGAGLLRAAATRLARRFVPGGGMVVGSVTAARSTERLAARAARYYRGFRP